VLIKYMSWLKSSPRVNAYFLESSYVCLRPKRLPGDNKIPWSTIWHL